MLSSLLPDRALEALPRCPLVYLPGLDGTGRLLHRQPALAERHDVCCISYPQDKPQTYAQLAAPVIEHLRQRGPGTLLAESFGGAVALTVALTAPALVRRMMLVNTFAYFPRRLLVRTAALLGRYFPDRPSPPSTRGLRGIFFFAPDIPAAERTAWWDRTADVPMSAFGRRLAMVAALDLRPQLTSIDIPTLVLVAPNDRLVPPKAGRVLAQQLARARLLELRAGHAALIHPAVDVARLLADAAYWPADVVSPVAGHSP
jgi:pimeloyl-ACP methyl ester carboxylesterase